MRIEQIGDATLYLGDCLEILPTLDSVDAVVTDPPYEIEGTWSGGHSDGWGKFNEGSHEAILWDKRPTQFIQLLIPMKCSKIVWGGQYFQLPPSGSWLVWDKIVRKFTAGHCELAWTNLGKPIRAFSYAHCQLASEGKFHPTQKPLPLMAWCLDFVPDAQTIFDPFMGSGTTGVACTNLGRKFIGIEIEPKYFDIACRRIRDAYAQPRLPLEEPPQAVPQELEL